MTSTAITVQEEITHQPKIEKVDSPWRFLRRIALFSLPFIGLLLFPVAFLYPSGDTLPIDKVIESQIRAERNGEELLFGRGISPEELRRYKLKMWLAINPDILVIGSSTSMQIRGAPFRKNGLSFYNAGGLVQGAKDLRDLIPLLDITTPKAIFLGIDFWWFNRNWKMVSMKSFSEIQKTPLWESEVELAVNTLRKVKSYPVQPARRSHAKRLWYGAREFPLKSLGLAARQGSGFRTDGSRRYPKYLKAAKAEKWDDGLDEYLERMRKGTVRFEHGTEVDAIRLSHLVAFARACKERNIELRAWLPPFSPGLFKALQTSAGHQQMLSDFRTRVPSALSSMGATVVDGMNPQLFQFDIRYFSDATHISEVGALDLVRALLRKRPMVDAPKLTSIVETMRDAAPNPATLGLESRNPKTQ